MRLSNSKKTILILVSMLGVTAGAGATATFAWFRTTRTSQISLTNAAVFGKGSIDVAYRAVEGGAINADNVNDDDGFDVAGLSQSITDVSGNGIAMYKPNFNPNDAATIKNPRILSVDDVTLVNDYICFGIDIKNKGTESYGIYLDGGSVIEGNDVDVSKTLDTTGMSSEEAASAQAQRTADIAQNAKNDRAAKATRVAFYTITESTYTNTMTWQQDTTDGASAASYKYINEGMSEEKAKDVNSSIEGETTHVTSIAHESDIVYNSYAAESLYVGSLKDSAQLTTSSGVASTRLVCTVPGSKTVSVNCSIWIEGSLSLATEECIGARIRATFNLIAL